MDEEKGGKLARVIVIHGWEIEGFGIKISCPCSWQPQVM